MTELHVHALMYGSPASSMDGEPPHCHVPSHKAGQNWAVLSAKDFAGRPVDHEHVIDTFQAVAYSSSGRPVAGDGR